MLRELIDAWRDKSLLNKMYEEFTRMLNDADWMFREVCELLLKGEEGRDLQKSLFKRDIAINKTERRIRKQIIEHLAIRPGTDVAACLILMSVVKDAERIGDYCKNLYDVWRLCGGPLRPSDFTESIEEMYQGLLGTFQKVAKGFAKADEKLGYDVVESELRFGRQLDDTVILLANSDLAAKDAVCLTLACRHMKRISAHLGNIASSVVMPVHKIDYFDEKWH